MAKKYRKIDPRIWNDEKFYSASLSCQHLFLFILTHPQMTPVGAMRTSPGGIEDELDWEQKGFPQPFREAFKEGLQKRFWEYDKTAKFLGVPNFTRYNPPDNPNVLKSWVGCWNDLPECDLKNKLYQRLKELAEGLGEGFYKGFAEGFPQTFGETGAGEGAGSTASAGSAEKAESDPDEPGWLVAGREANPKLSDEQIRGAWGKFKAHKNSRQPNPRFQWLKWIQNEFDGPPPRRRAPGRSTGTKSSDEFWSAFEASREARA
ncbi:hypothetical protein F3N42_03760 [Marinihelvus fidelis]|uniref:Uncharacterized protein n=1 Tax=Marinihelvus fidelis TaxID=2613842 RepID=A0A5N0TG77_9GAMM|nr:hypothetical protein [Marinihelvus fidelis]KAA9133478.1 hypothetical protein F3N42_03760 [Marinihelvus fidelis]